MKNYFFKEVNNNRGFTLIELLAVISILSIVSVIVMYGSVNLIDSAKEKSYEVTISNIEKEAGSYAIENQSNIMWVDVDHTGSKQYFCVSVQDLIDTGYFKSDVMDSYIKENVKISSDDYIYLERDTNSKTVTKNVLLSSLSSSYDGLCRDSKTLGNISFRVEPSGWTKEKTVTITYKVLNNKDNIGNYKYLYEYVDRDGNKTDIIERK